MLRNDREALDIVSLDTLAAVLREDLPTVFKECTVDILEAKQGSSVVSSWTNLSIRGLGGSPKLVDIGGVPNLLEPKGHHLSFDICSVAETCGLSQGLFFGAGAGDARHVGRNSELMPLYLVSEEGTVSHNETRVAFLTPEKGDDCFECTKYSSTRVGFLANLFACKGEPCSLLSVKVSGRTGSQDFISAIHRILKTHFPDKAIGLGGIFRMHRARFKAHIMPDFKETVMKEGPEVDAWLRFFEFQGKGAVFLSTCLTRDPREKTGGSSLHLRLTHTHFWNPESGEGGHYHYDVTPEGVTYEAIFALAHEIVRIEDPFPE